MAVMTKPHDKTKRSPAFAYEPGPSRLVCTRCRTEAVNNGQKDAGGRTVIYWICPGCRSTTKTIE